MAFAPRSKRAAVDDLAGRTGDQASEDVSVQPFTEEVNRRVHKDGIGSAAMETKNAPRIVAIDGAEAARRLAVVSPGLIDGAVVRRPWPPPGGEALTLAWRL